MWLKKSEIASKLFVMLWKTGFLANSINLIKSEQTEWSSHLLQLHVL